MVVSLGETGGIRAAQESRIGFQGVNMTSDQVGARETSDDYLHGIYPKW